MTNVLQAIPEALHPANECRGVFQAVWRCWQCIHQVDDLSQCIEVPNQNAPGLVRKFVLSEFSTALYQGLVIQNLPTIYLIPTGRGEWNSNTINTAIFVRIPHDNLRLILRYPTANLFCEKTSVEQDVILGNDGRHITA